MEGAEDLSVPLKPLNVLLVAGDKDHGPGEHDYPAWLHAWSQLLAAADGISIDTAMEWPSAAQLEKADNNRSRQLRYVSTGDLGCLKE